MQPTRLGVVSWGSALLGGLLPEGRVFGCVEPGPRTSVARKYLEQQCSVKHSHSRWFRFRRRDSTRLSAMILTHERIQYKASVCYRRWTISSTSRTAPLHIRCLYSPSRRYSLEGKSADGANTPPALDVSGAGQSLLMLFFFKTQVAKLGLVARVCSATGSLSPEKAKVEGGGAGGLRRVLNGKRSQGRRHMVFRRLLKYTFLFFSTYI